MNEFFNFVQDNWQLLVIIVLDLISLLFFLFRRKIKIVDSPLTSTIEKLPSWINVSEFLFTAGVDKKSYVKSLALEFYRALGGKSNIDDVLDEAIENILKTPQRKEKKDV